MRGRAFDGAWILPVLAAFTLSMFFALLAGSPAEAAEPRSGDQVVVGPEEEVDDDLYAFANTVVIDGQVNGDVVAAGQRITVNGRVEGDVMAAGRAVEINGPVEGSARIAGQALLVGERAQISEDVISAGQSLEVGAGSSVGRDLLFGGSQALVAGSVGRDLRGGMNALELRGEVGRDVDVSVGEEGAAPGVASSSAQISPSVSLPALQSGLTVTDSARIGGDLTYSSPTEAAIASGAQIEGETNWERVAAPADEQPTALSVFLEHLRRFVALVVVGLLMVWVVPGWTRRTAETVRQRPLPSLGIGLLSIVAFGVLAFAVGLAAILLAVIFGISTLGELTAVSIGAGTLVEGALVLAFLISVGYLAQVIVSFLGGWMILERILPSQASGRVLPLVLGLLVYVLLSAIPIVGVLVTIVVVLFGLGAMGHWLWSALRGARAAAPAPEGGSASA